jgi:hypothetical protein
MFDLLQAPKRVPTTVLLAGINLDEISLPPEVRERLVQMHGGRINKINELVM